MKKILASFLTIFFFAIQLFAQVQVKSPACENLVNPIGLDAVKPRFSWQLDAPNRNCMQTSYEIKVSFLWTTTITMIRIRFLRKLPRVCTYLFFFDYRD